MKNNDQKKVIDFVKSAKPRSSEHKIISIDTYLDGVVARVGYLDNNDRSEQWVVIVKNHSGYADSESQLIQQMGIASDKSSGKLDWLNQVFNVSGIIALVLVLTSSYLSIHNENGNVPEHLKAALLTIIGFYFGGLIQQKRKKGDEA